MGENERDQTGDWVLPAEARPPTMAHLERKIDHALAVATASEAAALEIGAAALDAAEQARRAAELAELASERASAGLAVVETASGDGGPGNGSDPVAEAVGDDDVPAEVEAAAETDAPTEADASPKTAYDSFKAFLERADRVSARLEAIAPSP